MTRILQGREILIGATGGIAVYKTAMLVSRLVQAGAGVSVVMTDAATKLVAPKTFEALSGRPVRVDMFAEPGHPHIDAARAAELFCIAPATANLLAKAAHGLADDLLTATLLSFDGPILLAPAMNCVMWEKSVVQRNVLQLREDDFLFIGPEEGRLSCGEVGEGRMASPESIFSAIVEALSCDEPPEPPIFEKVD